MGDQIDKAIADAGQQAPKAPMHQINLTIQGTGRTVHLLVPLDLQTGELLEFLSWAPIGITTELQKARNPASRLVIAGAPLPGLKQKQ